MVFKTITSALVGEYKTLIDQNVFMQQQQCHFPQHFNFTTPM